MAERPPESAHDDFKHAFLARDLDALVALYEDDATFVNADGSTVQGKAAIREALAGFLAALGADGTMSLETRYAVRHGDLALLSNAWHLRGSGADGQPVDLHGLTTEVVRRQADGRWLYIIDHPLGAS